MTNNNLRFNGKLVKWNADRGFGFVVADHGEQELFVHISAFPRDGRVPAVGEALNFEMELDPQGRKRAVRVGRPGAAMAARAARAAAPTAGRDPSSRHGKRRGRASRGLDSLIAAALLVAGLGAYGYQHYSERQAMERAMQATTQHEPGTRMPVMSQPVPASAVFRCDGRKWCSEMTSCSEAKRFLQNCPGMEMDGDGDGIPCEQQLCDGPFGG